MTISDDQDEDEEEIDWEVDQKLPEVLPESILSKKPRYGFDLKYSNYFEPLQVKNYFLSVSHTFQKEELFEIIDLKDPDRISDSEFNRRKSERIEHENSKFDEDYYMYIVYCLNKIIEKG